MANKCWLIPYACVVFSFCFHSVAYLPITLGLRWDQAKHWKKKAKKKNPESTEPSGSLGKGTGKRLTSPPLPPAPPLPQSSPPLRSPTFFAVPPNLVPRVFWLVGQRGDARIPLGGQGWRGSDESTPPPPMQPGFES